MKPYHLIPAMVLAFAACGGGDAADTGTPNTGAASQPAAAAPSGPVAPTGPMSIPDWYVIDNAAETVHLTITAGSVPDNNYWNFNGAIRGSLAITVPAGFTVTIELINRDPNMAHSVGISNELRSFTAPPAPTPAFPGAITANPQSMMDATMPGESESFTFVADAAGNYSMVCYIAGHSAVGMWLFFNVSGDGSAGVQGL